MQRKKKRENKGQAQDEKNPEKHYLENEYEIGNELCQGYFKGGWAAHSVFIPICFGLVAVSYSTLDILRLKGDQLMPLAAASILLYSYGDAFIRRYAGYSKSIFKRLRQIEDETGMKLHKRIDKDDKARKIKWNLRHIKLIMFVLLVLTWIQRLYLAPLVQA